MPFLTGAEKDADWARLGHVLSSEPINWSGGGTSQIGQS